MKNIALFALFFSLAFVTIELVEAKDEELCDIYDLKYLEYMHISFELECSTKNLAKHKKCRNILRIVKHFNRLRSKHCYED